MDALVSSDLLVPIASQRRITRSKVSCDDNKLLTCALPLPTYAFITSVGSEKKQKTKIQRTHQQTESQKMKQAATKEIVQVSLHKTHNKNKTSKEKVNSMQQRQKRNKQESRADLPVQDDYKHSNQQY